MSFGVFCVSLIPVRVSVVADRAPSVEAFRQAVFRSCMFRAAPTSTSGDGCLALLAPGTQTKAVARSRTIRQVIAENHRQVFFFREPCRVLSRQCAHAPDAVAKAHDATTRKSQPAVCLNPGREPRGCSLSIANPHKHRSNTHFKQILSKKK